MRVVNLECPFCNAPLSINGDRRTVYCSYCGHQILLDDETVNFRFSNAYEAGRDFERGRQSAANHGPNSELAARIKQTMDKLICLEELDRQLTEAQSDLDKERGNKATIGIGVFVCFFFALGLMRVHVLLGLIGLGIACAIYSKASQTAKEKKREIINEKQERVNQIYENRENLQNKDTGLIISKEYMSIDILDVLYTYVVNGQANSIRQAIDLYEDQKHKKEMERLTREQVETQKRILEKQEEQASKTAGLNLGKAVLLGGLAIATGRFLGRRR